MIEFTKFLHLAAARLYDDFYNIAKSGAHINNKIIWNMWCNHAAAYKDDVPFSYELIEGMPK